MGPFGEANRTKKLEPHDKCIVAKIKGITKAICKPPPARRAACHPASSAQPRYATSSRSSSHHAGFQKIPTTLRATIEATNSGATRWRSFVERGWSRIISAFQPPYRTYCAARVFNVERAK